ncbi:MULTISPECIES: SGNH/GDSL hydrolase family protein [Ralstonia solanacearum species complex]|uniref:SGNH/GDSL hydrolase family protein n=1 Tax=Ralstonia solanacearum species complex TaxID=3116862 RepID=UPI00030B5E52|nr:SGNH/GDSL hydrolase family protein [Ralstonia pseudosolanacearum]AXW16945.1 GDSL family lipase [Ralstonia solanacearum]AXW73689.1 GDSL family lipase [Ralstonia solanacearum]MCK4123315.1 GDSL family lipase [Ralstonia pseudosolanacearum]BEU69762.1 SGNH/GDSL hydrolase family protein [Ralstonia pseudosolanacearum]
MSLRQWMVAATAALALSLTACGGGETDQSGNPSVVKVQRMVVFGDSLSDAGTYTPVAQAVGGGRFTTNPGPVWAETVASQLGVALTPAVMGYGTSVQSCPKAGCFDYAQGGSRVTDPDGIGHNGGAGALTYPVKQQLANFYAASNNAFNGNSDIVFVLAGNNDIFFWSAAVATSSSGVTPAIATAQVQQAATDLVGYVKDMIAKGATQVYVFNLPDSSLTPQGVASGTTGQELLRALVGAFNTTLQSGLAGTSARIIDFNSQLTAVIQNGASFGFANTSATACDATKVNALVPNAGGSSLFCSANTLVASGADQSYLFADGVHPTTAGHRLIASNVLARLLADSVAH